MTAPDSRRLQFGLFEIDCATGELRKGGIKIKLQDQPFQVVSALLDRPGQIVTREELRQKIWPADTFIDFDQSLNKAINKIREALGDSRRLSVGSVGPRREPESCDPSKS